MHISLKKSGSKLHKKSGLPKKKIIIINLVFHTHKKKSTDNRLIVFYKMKSYHRKRNNCITFIKKPSLFSALQPLLLSPLTPSRGKGSHGERSMLPKSPEVFSDQYITQKVLNFFIFYYYSSRRFKLRG